MKLRIQGNSIRLRIQQQELLALHASGRVIERVEFGVTPAEQLEYVLEQTVIDELSVSFVAGRLVVHIPAAVVAEMVDTDRVGISGEVVLSENKTLSVLVEKDFKCLTPRADDIDAFPHPEADIGHRC